jgi:RHS repeat-associated protein
MRHRPYSRWLRRTSAVLLVPILLCFSDFGKFAHAMSVRQAQRKHLLEIAEKQHLDPEMLLDPAAYQKHQAEQAKVRRAKAIKEMEERTKPDPIALANAEAERADIIRRHSHVALAAMTTNIEGVRQAAQQLRSNTLPQRDREAKLNSIDAYARVFSHAGDEIKRYDQIQRDMLKKLPASIRARHDHFIQQLTPQVHAMSSQLDNFLKAAPARKLDQLGGVERQVAHIPQPPVRPAQHAMPNAPRKAAAIEARFDSEALIKKTPGALSPKVLDEADKAVKSMPSGGFRKKLFELPGFVFAVLGAPTAADLAATDETPLSADITAKATALNHDPIQIYNFVHDQIVNEVYYASKKGARATLAEMAGNDFDQASLLIALLRASNIPARYEYGTVTLSPQQAMDFTGTDNINSAASALVSSGYPASRIASGNSFTGVNVELAWVRAFIPYGNYRGHDISGNAQGSIWIHLLPSIKRYQPVTAANLVGAVPFDFDAFLTRDQPKSPVATWEDQVRAYLQAHPNLNCTTLEGAQLARVPIADNLPILPEALPAKLAQSLMVFSAVPQTMKLAVELIGRSSAGGQILDYKSSVAALYAQNLSIQFEPATPDDAAVLASYGGLEQTPAYLVHLRATLLNGETPLAMGSSAESPGLVENFDVHFSIPNLSEIEPSHHPLTVGGIYAWVIDDGTMPDALVDAAQQLQTDLRAANASSDDINAARVLEMGRRYFKSLDKARDRIVGLYQARYFKDVYEGTFGLDLRATTLNGIPVSVRRSLVNLDVDQLTTTPFAVNGQNQYSATMTRMMLYEASYDESFIPQAFYGPNQFSAVRLLGMAAQAGQTVFVTDQSNVDFVLSRIAAPDAVEADVRNEVGRGRVVRIHSMAMTPPSFIPLWGYTAEDLQTGAGAARINAQFDGGVGDVENLAQVPHTAAQCPVCFNQPAGSGQGASVVHLASGNYVHRSIDLVLAARGISVAFVRTYSSFLGWHHNYDQHIDANSDGTLTYTDDRGVPRLFTPSGSGFWNPPPLLFQHISSSGNGYLMRFKEGMTYSFDATGRLVAQQDLNGYTVSLAYDANHRLRTVSGAGGSTFTLGYDTLGRLTSVSDSAGRQVGFGYDGSGVLVRDTDPLGHSRTYVYDAAGRMVQKTDYRGNQVVIWYDDLGRVVEFDDPMGGVRRYAYDLVNSRTVHIDRMGASTTFELSMLGQPTRITDPLGNTHMMAYDPRGNRTADTDARGNGFSYVYDPDGNLLSQTDPLGATTSLTYDSNARVLTTTDALSEQAANTYDNQGNLLTATDALSNTTTLGYQDGLPVNITRPGGAALQVAYDGSGNISQVVDPEGGMTTLGYDAAGHLTSILDPNQNLRALSVDAKGQLLSVATPLGNTTSFEYDADGNRTSMTDPEGHTTRFVYDQLGRLVSTTDAVGKVTRQEHDAEGRITARIDARGFRTEMTYDALGRLASIRDPLGNTTSMGYCAELEEQPCTIIDSLGNTTRIQEDQLGREIARADSLGHTVQTSYDLLGRRATVTDAANKTTTFGYDPVGRLQSVLDALNHLTQFGYDGRGNLTSVTDANNHTTAFGYDRANRITTETTPINTTTEFGYDPGGNRTSKLDAKGQLTQFRYDPDRRLTDITYSDGSAAHFEYNARGNKILEENVDITRHMTYDDVGRVTTVEDTTAGHAVSYTYDAAGNRATMQLLPEGETTHYNWDARGLLSRLVDPEDGTYQFAYDGAGRRLTTIYPNGMTRAQSFDAASRVLSMVYSSRTGSVLQSFTYDYDSRGNRLSKGFSDGTAETYGYDDLSRLTSAAYPSGRNVTYVYDGVGNRQSMTESGVVSGGTTTYEYNVFNQLLTLSGPGGTTSFQYDANGNQTQKQEPNGTTTYTWDSRDRLTQVDTAAATSRFGYDSNGLRVAVRDLEGSHRLVLDGLEELAEYDASAATQIARFDHDPTRVDGLLGEEVSGQGKNFFLVDALGSVYGLVDPGTSLTAQYSYDAFGTRTPQLNQISTAWGFTGRRLDGELEYARARYYDAQIGRFSSSDPAGMVDGPNRYLYTANAPTGATDPLGLWILIDKQNMPNWYMVEIVALTAALDMITASDTWAFDYVESTPWSSVRGPWEPTNTIGHFSFAQRQVKQHFLATDITITSECDISPPMFPPSVPPPYPGENAKTDPMSNKPALIALQSRFFLQPFTMQVGTLIHEFTHVATYFSGYPDTDPNAPFTVVYMLAYGTGQTWRPQSALKQFVFFEAVPYYASAASRFSNPENLYVY